MKILLLSTGGHIGGEETFTRNLAKALIDRGHYVIAAAGGPVQRLDLEKRGIPVAAIDITARSISGIIQGVVQLKKYLDEIKPDIVHCQSAGPAIMGGILKKYGQRKAEKWIYHDHGINRFTYKWLPFFLNSLDLTITNSDFELIRLKANGVKDNRIVRIHNGIEPGDFTFADKTRIVIRTAYRNDFGISGDEFLLGYIGRLSPEKGCDLLLPAIKLVSDNFPEIKLMIVGDGIMRDKMQEDVKSYNLERKIIFTGFRSDIPEILTCMDALVLPSYMETFSLTTLQAMGSGIPVIASDAGGNPEQIVNNFNGFLFETGNVYSFTDRITQMFNSKNRARMGCNGHMLVENYLNATRMVDEIEYQYKRIM